MNVETTTHNWGVFPVGSLTPVYITSEADAVKRAKDRTRVAEGVTGVVYEARPLRGDYAVSLQISKVVPALFAMDTTEPVQIQWDPASDQYVVVYRFVFTAKEFAKVVTPAKVQTLKFVPEPEPQDGPIGIVPNE